MKFSQMGSCLAYVNCLSGCPYNAKSSTDKNYLVSAIQAGCIVKTECQAQYVVRNMHDHFQHKGKNGRRWMVYLNEIDYVTCDFVILSDKKQSKFVCSGNSDDHKDVNKF